MIGWPIACAAVLQALDKPAKRIKALENVEKRDRVIIRSRVGLWQFRPRVGRRENPISRKIVMRLDDQACMYAQRTA
jgi:hypothetical protein